VPCIEEDTLRSLQMPRIMPNLRAIIDRIIGWIAGGTRFSYLLPDTLELMLLLTLAAYYAMQVQQEL
jgi:hypothetical protein